MISAGLVLESIGAFGYDGDDSRIEALTTLHNSAWLIEFLGVPVPLIGILLGVFSLTAPLLLLDDVFSKKRRRTARIHQMGR